MVRRARVFLSVAQELLERNEYDLAVFNAEQAVQLRLKALLYRLWGIIPRSYSIRWLLGLLRDSLLRAGLGEAAEKVDEFVRSNRSLLAALEDAYTLTRYGHLEYDYELASRLLALSENLWRLLEEVEKLAIDLGETGSGET